MKHIKLSRSFSLLALGLMLLITNSCSKDDGPSGTGTVLDQSGNEYHTVTIGTQVWMVENLKASHYRNGDPITNVTDQGDWDNLTTGAFCYYNNAPTNNEPYGKLYNWHAVNDSRNIAPVGWRVPTIDDWNTLITFLGGEDLAADKLKEVGNLHWDVDPDIVATNISGFTALPGGERSSGFYNIGQEGYLWTSTYGNVQLDSGIWRILLESDSHYVTTYIAQDAEKGYSVRLIRD